MKKTTTMIVFTLLVAALTACGSASTNAQSGAAPMNGSGPGTLPELSQLIIGTMKLDETSYAVTAEQAAGLLPLWQVYQSLSTSDTAAPEEVDALVRQIQESMTAEQTQAIQDMQLTQEDMMAFLQEQGLSMTGPGGQEMNAEQMATVEALRSSGGGEGFSPPDGGGPGGGGPGGGGFAGGGGGGFPGGGEGGQALNPDQIATLQAGRPAGGGGGFNRVPSVLIDALLQFLQEKAGS